MNCEQIQEHLVEYLYGELPDELTSKVEAELDNCPECAKSLEQMRELHQLVAAMPRLDVPAQAHNNIIREARLAAAPQASEARGQSPVWLRWLTSPAFATAVVICLVLGVGVLLRDKGSLSTSDEPQLADSSGVESVAVASAEEQEQPPPTAVAAPAEQPEAVSGEPTVVAAIEEEELEEAFRAVALEAAAETRAREPRSERVEFAPGRPADDPGEPTQVPLSDRLAEAARARGLSQNTPDDTRTANERGEEEGPNLAEDPADEPEEVPQVVAQLDAAERAQEERDQERSSSASRRERRSSRERSRDRDSASVEHQQAHSRTEPGLVFDSSVTGGAGGATPSSDDDNEIVDRTETGLPERREAEAESEPEPEPIIVAEARQPEAPPSFDLPSGTEADRNRELGGEEASDDAADGEELEVLARGAREPSGGIEASERAAVPEDIVSEVSDTGPEGRWGYMDEDWVGDDGTDSGSSAAAGTTTTTSETERSTGADLYTIDLTTDRPDQEAEAGSAPEPNEPLEGDGRGDGRGDTVALLTESSVPVAPVVAAAGPPVESEGEPAYEAEEEPQAEPDEVAAVDPDQLYNDGLVRYNDGSYREAIEYFQLFIQNVPQSNDLFALSNYYQGQARMNIGDYEGAMGNFVEIDDATFEHYVEAQLLLANSYEYSGELDEAEVIYNRLLTLDDDATVDAADEGLERIRQRRAEIEAEADENYPMRSRARPAVDEAMEAAPPATESMEKATAY